VIYNRHVDGTSVGSVAPDFERMGRLLARKILHGGYERVVFWRQWRLECHEDPVDRARECNFAGYHDAVYGGLLACGLMEQQVVVLPEGGPDGRDRWGEASYVGEVLERLDLNRGPRTAFVTTSDRWALHLVETLRERGVEVPRRCGVIGRHNLEVNRTATRPVTTWETNPAEIGRVAAQMLLERIEFPDREQARRYVAQALVDHGTL
jgi:DNA-binding LacI/PurR family transcriptional regulator